MTSNQKTFVLSFKDVDGIEQTIPTYQNTFIAAKREGVALANNGNSEVKIAQLEDEVVKKQWILIEGEYNEVA